MTVPTEEQNDAARAWLEQWVPDYTTGQWAALAELLAQRGGRDPAERRPGMYVFEHRGSGSPELEAAPTELYATSLDAAVERAQLIGRELGATLRFVGFWADATSVHRRFEAGVPYDELPAWARLYVDDQRDAAVQKAKPRAKRGKAA